MRRGRARPQDVLFCVRNVRRESSPAVLHQRICAVELLHQRELQWECDTRDNGLDDWRLQCDFGDAGKHATCRRAAAVSRHGHDQLLCGLLVHDAKCHCCTFGGADRCVLFIQHSELQQLWRKRSDVDGRPINGSWIHNHNRTNECAIDCKAEQRSDSCAANGQAKQRSSTSSTNNRAADQRNADDDTCANERPNANANVSASDNDGKPTNNKSADHGDAIGHGRLAEHHIDPVRDPGLLVDARAKQRLRSQHLHPGRRPFQKLQNDMQRRRR